MSVLSHGVVRSASSSVMVEVVGADDPDLVSAGAAAHRAASFAARDLGLAGDIAIAFVSDEEMAHLNRSHRAIDGPTDVLTFPAPVEIGGGDIAIARGYLERQAARRNVATEDEAAILALHGVLHLAGYDDLAEVDRSQMQRETKRLADGLGVPCEDAWTSLPEGDS